MRVACQPGFECQEVSSMHLDEIVSSEGQERIPRIRWSQI